MLRTLGRPVLRLMGAFGDSRRRRHTVLLIVGALAAAGGMLAYGLVVPEIPFAEAPVKLVRDLRVGDTVKIYGRIECNCSKPIDREETSVGANGRTWNATYATFTVDDPSGKMFIDTSAVTRLTPGPSGGDWLDGDWVAAYGTVYDQGHGNLALLANMMAKTPTDTPAVNAFYFELIAAFGAILLAYVLTDKLLFGGTMT